MTIVVTVTIAIHWSSVDYSGTVSGGLVQSSGDYYTLIEQSSLLYMCV